MCHGYQIWSKELLMQVKNDDDLHGGQRSSEVKCGKVCATATIFGQKSCWCKLRMMMTFMEVKGQQRSNIVNYTTWLSNLVRSAAGASLGWWGPSWMSKVKRGQIVDNDLWLPNLVRRFADTSLGWLWPSQRSKVSKGHNNKQFSIATKLGRKSSWCKFMMTVTFMEVKGQQRSNTVNNICTTYMIFGE